MHQTRISKPFIESLRYRNCVRAGDAERYAVSFSGGKENEMNRSPQVLLLTLVAAVSFIGGATCQTIIPLTSRARAQEQQNNEEPRRVLIHGVGQADSSKRPPVAWERFTLGGSRKVVPPGKTFVLTDMMYTTRGVTENLTVNLGRVSPEDKTHTLLQVDFRPGESKETHLCTGYVVPSGYGLAAWTNAGLAPDQKVHIAFTGYFIEGEPR
jgi:hypothetical protein